MFRTLDAGYVGEAANSGLYERQLNTSFTPTGIFGMNEDALRPTGRNFTKFVNAGGKDDRQVYFIIPTIRLRDVSSFFEKLPLVKGMYGRLEFRFNLGSMVITQTAGAGAVINVKTSNADCQFPTGVCPFMLVPLSQKSPVEQTKLIAGIYIAKPAQSMAAFVGQAASNHSTFAADAHELQQVRLYYPQVELTTGKIACIFSSQYK
jgi:hypothetical protein